MKLILSRRFLHLFNIDIHPEVLFGCNLVETLQNSSSQLCVVRRGAQLYKRFVCLCPESFTVLSLAQNLGCYSPPNKNQFWCRWSMVQMCTCLMGHSEPSHMCTFAHFPDLIGLITNLSYHRLWLSYLSCVCLCLFFIIKIL